MCENRAFKSLLAFTNADAVVQMKERSPPLIIVNLISKLLAFFCSRICMLGW
jgi:hypothetical protein